MAKFRELASPFGEIVMYERDVAARDIGLHFTRKRPSGDETVTGVLRWFQLKGIAAATLDAKTIASSDSISFKLEVKHLRLWYQYPDPTYLVLYLQVRSEFLVMDIQKYVEEHWGDSILSLDQQEATVKVPCASV